MGDSGGRPSSIGDYGFVSDCQSAALVDRAGSVDWWCVPRFDSPSVFARLLGPDAGHWSLCPSAAFESTRHYVPDALVLRNVFTTAGGEVTVSDALGLELGARGHEIGFRSPHVLLRRVEGIRGAVEMVTEFAPRMEYGLTVPNVLGSGQGPRARPGPRPCPQRRGHVLARPRLCQSALHRPCRRAGGLPARLHALLRGVELDRPRRRGHARGHDRRLGVMGEAPRRLPGSPPGGRSAQLSDARRPATRPQSALERWPGTRTPFDTE